MAKKLDSANLKEQILSDIRKLSVDGNAPGLERFIRDTRWTRTQIDKLWGKGSWTEAIREAGFAPKEFGTMAQTEEQLLHYLAELVKTLRRFPAQADFLKASFEQNLPSYTTFKKYLGYKPEMVGKLLSWINENPEYDDLVAVVSAEANQAPSPFQKASNDQSAVQELGNGYTLRSSFIPPIIECLPDMARNLPSIIAACKQKNLSISKEFEERVAVAFGLLGFSVENLGQGMGRKPDGIAKCFENNYAIIYDAKVRTTDFRLAAVEDRKFKEYLETTTPQLRKQGIRNFYFAIVSSGFVKRDIPKAQELCRLTEAKSCVLIEADALLNLVEKKLRNPNNFSSDDLEKAFSVTKILTRSV